MRNVCRLLLLAAALPLAAQTPPPSPLQQATAAFEEFRLDDALRLAQPLAAKDPAAQELTGRILLMKGDTDGAVAMLEKAVAARPNDSTYHYHLGEAYGRQAQEASMFSQMGLAKKTHAEFERAVELDPKSIDARFALIEYALVAPSMLGGGEDKALAQAAAIRTFDPLWGHRAYASIYMRQKKTDLARKEYQDAVREMPNSPAAHYAYAGFLARDKKFAEAMTEVAAAQKLDPAYMPALYLTGSIAGSGGTDLARGEQALRRYLEYRPKEHEPDHVSAWYWLGMVLEKQGKKAEARQAYATVLKMSPKHKNASEALKRVS